jgi:hypothetical protein
MTTTTNGPMTPFELQQMLDRMHSIAQMHDDLPPVDTPAGRITREFFANNWANCCDGLLAKTNKIRVTPQPSAAPHVFRYEIATKYKRKAGRDAEVELMPGPIRGTIHYRSDVFSSPMGPAIAARVDLDQQILHPNVSRQHGFVCLGELPLSPFPFPLDPLLEHLYTILTYQNYRPSHPLDMEAAAYFALEADALAGLEGVEPLY